jgi:hypothetical protein
MHCIIKVIQEKNMSDQKESISVQQENIPDQQKNISHHSPDHKPTRDQERSTEQNPTMPPGRSDLALKRFENLHENKDGHKENSLQEHARERAEHPNDLKVGSPYEWEQLEDYKKELDRLDREGPKLRNP